MPAGIGWWHTFGRATLFLLVVQAATGMFLGFYYVPSPEHAYEAVSQISNDLALGWLVRGIHRWGASLTVIMVGLHRLRVLYMGAYKYPKELTWVVGVRDLLVSFLLLLALFIVAWRPGALLGEPADPASATFVPRPEWYFYFLSLAPEEVSGMVAYLQTLR